MVARPGGTAGVDLSDTVFDKTNLTNFSDAVIAIAITLLVLELKLPITPGEDINPEFLYLLYSELPVFISFVVSFFVIASLWYAYHRFMKYVVRLDSQTVVLNLVFLLFIAFLPFPTSILGMYPASPMVVAFYGLIIFIVGSTSYLMRNLAIRNGNLMAEADQKIIRSLQLQSLNNCTFALVSVPIAFISPWISILMWLCAPPIGRLVINTIHREKPDAAQEQDSSP